MLRITQGLDYRSLISMANVTAQCADEEEGIVPYEPGGGQEA